MSGRLVRVEVAYAVPERQEIVTLQVPDGTTVFEAAEQSGICIRFPEIDLQGCSLGVFGKVVKAPRTQLIREGERVEIYRPLKVDPKQARLNRAKKI